MPPETLLAPLAEAPEESALLFDVDGVLAPIVARPELATVPPGVRAELRRLTERYLLVACVSGRAGPDARRLVGVEGVEIVGNHGLELDPRAGEHSAALSRFGSAVAWPVEDKGLSLTLHYRCVEDEEAALAALEAVAARAEAAGLVPRWGRKVLEIRPPLATDKGTAVTALIERSGARRALYAGDDATDLDAFAALEAARLEHRVRIAVASVEGPRALAEAAELVVAGPEALLAILRLL